ncbi:hypothetical protein BHC42_01410 [Snodgrassella alvi]|nr:hypothetical protein BHC50_07595 [Snodgrassella alvi]PIT36796.1 hypothetical protein BHC42_01410 [Snodgrassella alvi]
MIRSHNLAKKTHIYQQLCRLFPYYPSEFYYSVTDFIYFYPLNSITADRKKNNPEDINNRYIYQQLIA